MAKPTESILLTIKKMLGIAEEYIAFDIDLIVNINSVFLTLNQLGVGPDKPYRIDGSEETWKDFLGDQDDDIAGVESYIYLRTRLLFDPPANSFLVNAIETQCKEFEWRLNAQAERRKLDEELVDKDPSESTEGRPIEDATERLRVLSTRRSSELELLRAAWNKGNALGSEAISES